MFEHSFDRCGKSVWQRCYAADFECAALREQLFLEFLNFQGVTSRKEISSMSDQSKDRLRKAWADYVQERAMVILYDPDME